MQKGKQEQREREWQYRNIFDSATDGLIVHDLETGFVVEANPAACLMHGYTREEFIGLPLAGFIHLDSQHEFSEYIQAFQSDGVFDTRILHIRKNGSKFYAEWRGRAFTYQGRPCLLGIVRDISERIRAEQNLRKRVETRAHEQDALLAISLWKQIREQSPGWWNLMSEYDLNKVDKAEVKFDKYVTMLQVKYGYTYKQAKLEIEKRVSEFEAEQKNKLETV